MATTESKADRVQKVQQEPLEPLEAKCVTLCAEALILVVTLALPTQHKSQGPSGIPGQSGFDGSPGSPGVDGDPGFPGENGSPGARVDLLCQFHGSPFSLFLCRDLKV